MTGTEEILEIILNLFVSDNEKNSMWTKDDEEFSKGYLVYGDESGIDAFIVTIQPAKIVLA